MPSMLAWFFVGLCGAVTVATAAYFCAPVVNRWRERRKAGAEDVTGELLVRLTWEGMRVERDGPLLPFVATGAPSLVDRRAWDEYPDNDMEEAA